MRRILVVQSKDPANNTYTVRTSVFHEILCHLGGRHRTNAVRSSHNSGSSRSTLVGGELEGLEQRKAVLAPLNGAGLDHGGCHFLRLNKLAHSRCFGFHGAFQHIRAVQF